MQEKEIQAREIQVQPSKDNSCAKRKRFSQKELEVVPKSKSLAKKYRFSHEKIEGR